MQTKLQIHHDDLFHQDTCEFRALLRITPGHILPPLNFLSRVLGEEPPGAAAALVSVYVCVYVCVGAGGGGPDAEVTSLVVQST